MGQTQSLEEQFLTTHHLQFVRDETRDIRFGAFKLYQNQEKNEFYQIQSKVYFNKEEAKKMKQQCKNRKALNSDFILKLVDYKSAQQKEYCSSYKKTVIIYEYIEQTLYDVFNQRKQIKIANNLRHIFREKEIWYILRSILNSLAYLKFNNSRLQISPFMQNVMLDHYGRVKINDGFLGNVANQIYQYLLVNKNQLNFQSSNPFGEYIEYYFPSPQILSNLKNQNPSPIHQPSKNEVFSLAMTILQLANIDKLSDCYDYQLLTINFTKVQTFQKRFQKAYSAELNSFLDSMLIEDEIQRLDIDDLMDIIENYENSSQIQIGAINQLFTEDGKITTEMNTDDIIYENGDEENKEKLVIENQVQEVNRVEKSKQQKHKEIKKRAQHGGVKLDDFYFYELKDYHEPLQNGPQEYGILPQFEIYQPNQSMHQSFQIIQEIQEKAKNIKIDNPQLIYQMKQQQALINSQHQQALNQQLQLQQQQQQQLVEQSQQENLMINNVPIQQSLIQIKSEQQLDFSEIQQQHHQEQQKQAKKVKNVTQNLQQLVEIDNSVQKNSDQDEIQKQQQLAISQQEEYQNQLIFEQKLFEIQQQQEQNNFQNSQLYQQHQETFKQAQHLNEQQQQLQQNQFNQEQLRRQQTAEYNEQEVEEVLKNINSPSKANQLYVDNYHSLLQSQNQNVNQNDYQYTHKAITGNQTSERKKSSLSQQHQLQQDFQNYFHDRSFQSYLNYQQQQLQEKQQYQQQFEDQQQFKQNIQQQLWPYQYIQDTNFPTERPTNIKQKQQIFT